MVASDSATYRKCGMPHQPAYTTLMLRNCSVNAVIPPKNEANIVARKGSQQGYSPKW